MPRAPVARLTSLDEVSEFGPVQACHLKSAGKNRKMLLKKVFDEVGESNNIPVRNATERLVNSIEKCKLVQTVGGVDLVTPCNMERFVADVPELCGPDAKA